MEADFDVLTEKATDTGTRSDASLASVVPTEGNEEGEIVENSIIAMK